MTTLKETVGVQSANIADLMSIINRLEENQQELKGEVFRLKTRVRVLEEKTGNHPFTDIEEDEGEDFE